MKTLRENNLIYGRLMRVDETHLVARYRTAMQAFELPPTKLKSFEIDMTGFSPDIAEELGDPQYLDPHGVNRRFIILSPAQAELPVVHTAFSNTEQLMGNFFAENLNALTALTIKDVIYGEIEDSVFQVDEIEDLLKIEQVEFKVNTPSDLLGQAGELKTLCDRLLGEPNAWQDDEMLIRMVDLAGQTGDIRANQLVPSKVVFRHNTFWTTHFGGLYVFIDENRTTVIGSPEARGFRRSRPWQVAFLDIADHRRVHEFLVQSGRIDPPRGSWIERSGLIDKRAQMCVAWLAARSAPRRQIKADSPRWVQNWIANNARTVEADGTLPLLTWITRQVADWANVDFEDIAPAKRFLVSRAKPGHVDHYLTNRLISEYLPFDYLTRFVFNKPGFYADYQSWPKIYGKYVVERIMKDYVPNKKAVRQQYYR